MQQQKEKRTDFTGGSSAVANAGDPDLGLDSDNDMEIPMDMTTQDLAEPSHSGKCPGCGGKPGIGGKFALGGDGKEWLRVFVQEERQRFLTSLGVAHTPNSADVPLEQMHICSTCRSRAYKRKDALTSGDRQDNRSPHIILSIPRIASTKRHCVYGHKSEHLYAIPEPTRRDVLVRHRIYIPPSAVCCKKHLEEGEWSQINSNINDYSPGQIEEMVDLLREQDGGRPFLDFENIEKMTDKRVVEWTGLTIAQFTELFSSVSSFKTMKRSKTALGLWLAKCRTGETSEKICDLAGLSRSTGEGYMAAGRGALTREWVGQHLGMGRLGLRGILTSHQTAETLGLFCDGGKVAIILDGTYTYIQKSSNYSFQRQSFSGHKHRHLLKPFMIVSPDGYIIDAIGPYQANVNDAAIARDIGAKLKEFLEDGDVCIVDRGFRDSIDHLTGLGLSVRMPEFKRGARLTADQANRTRLVTKCRWVVEARNGHLKTIFRRFDKVWPNKSLSYMMEDFRIACAILNVFHPPLESDIREGIDIAETMLARCERANSLGELVTAQGLNRKSASFESIDGTSLDFPQLTETDLRLITLGSYQLKQAPSYYAEHIQRNGRYTIEVCKHVGPLSLTSHGLDSVGDPKLIRGRIQSRHHSSTQYFTYILIDCVKSGVETISSYYCSCPDGSRTVGCCAHTATVLWYLGYARHLDEIPIPASFLDDVGLPLGQEQ